MSPHEHGGSEHLRKEAEKEARAAADEVYRGILRAAGNATQSLADELRLCEAYLRVEGARYGERLQVSFTVAEGLDPRGVHVPMLLLQPLVENAVRHGIAPRASRGTVSIRAALEGDRVMIFVDDDGVGLGNSGVKGFS